MKTAEVKHNIKLGAFVIGGLALFLVAVFFIGSENNVFSKTFTVYSVFKNVEGLKEGDNVWLSGVKIGTVRNVKIVSEGRVVVTLLLKDKQNEFIRKNATAFIGSDGLVGNKIVVVRPGDAGQSIGHNDTINTMSPTDTQELINIAKDVGENTRSLTNDLKTLSKRIADGEGIVGELLKDGEFAQDLRQTASNLRNTGSNMTKASSELSGLVYEMRNGQGVISKLVKDTSMASVFDEALVNVKNVSANSAKIAGELEAVAAKINSNENALGLLLADTAFANKLEKTMMNTESATGKLDENMEALKHNFLFRGYFRRQERKKKNAE